MATPRVIHAAHAGGALVVPWTVNDAATMHALLERGVDGLISDEPERLRSVLEERGAWSGAASVVEPGKRRGETRSASPAAVPAPRNALPSEDRRSFSLIAGNSGPRIAARDRAAGPARQQAGLRRRAGRPRPALGPRRGEGVRS
jgi:hypothetical protein